MNDNTRNVMFSSKTEMWATPQFVFDNLNDEFNFNLDACAIKDNAKCEQYYTPEVNALTQPWQGSVWMNPPYDAIYEWMKYAWQQSLRGSRVVCLIPARTDTRAFHQFCKFASEIRFVKGRLKFGDGSNSAPFPSMVVIFDQSEFMGSPKMSFYDVNNSCFEEKDSKAVYFDLRNAVSFERRK